MKLEEQVLSIAQVQELQELGFDVNKYASVEVNITEKGNKFIISKEFIKLFPKFGDNNVIKRYYSMTIGDMMEILPERIEDIYNYDFQSAKLNGKFIVRYNDYKHEFKESYFIIEDKIQINVLFETLKWCIKEKHIKL